MAESTALLRGLGTIDLSSEEEVCNYFERFAIIVDCSGITAENTALHLLAVVGAEAYDLIKSLGFPTKPRELTVAKIEALLIQHVRPMKVEAKERANFDMSVQSEKETTTAFILRLQKQARFCNFGEGLNDRLRDRLVAGCKSIDLRRKLLNTRELTWAKAREIVSTFEAVNTAADDLSSNNTSVLFVTPTPTRTFSESFHSSHATSRNADKGYYRRVGSTQANPSSSGGAGEAATFSAVRRGGTVLRSSRRGSGAAKPPGECYGCKGDHWKRDCPFKDSKCHRCGKVGHIQKMCRVKDTKSNFCEIAEQTEFVSFATDVAGVKGHVMKLVQFESDAHQLVLDTGSEASLIPYARLKTLAPNARVRPTKTNLKGLSGQTIGLAGEALLHVKLDGTEGDVVFLLANNPRSPSIAGLNFLRSLNVSFTFTASEVLADGSPKVLTSNVPSTDESSNAAATNSDCPKAKSAKSDPVIFSNTIDSRIPALVHKCGHNSGGMRIDPVSIPVNGNPIYLPRRTTSYGLRPAIRHKLQTMSDDGLISPVRYSHWGTPIVVVPKPDQDVRICGDYSVTVNKALLHTSSPVVETDEFLSRIQGAKVFSKIDLEGAFNQIPLDDSAKALTTINTEEGLFRYNFLPFGLECSSTIFTQELRKILHENGKPLPGVVDYMDDILIHGEDRADHDKNLFRLLTILDHYNIRINSRKCIFAVKSVPFLGFMVDGDGARPDMRRADAICNAPSPQNHVQLKSAICCLQFYSRFVKGFADIAEPLFELQNSGDFIWQEKHEAAFRKLKFSISSEPVLKPFCVGKKCKLTVDASEVGLGACLEQNEHPVLYISRRLTKSERGYSQTQKEALGMKWAIKRLHKFLFGNHFVLVTDHTALIYILVLRTVSTKLLARCCRDGRPIYRVIILMLNTDRVKTSHFQIFCRDTRLWRIQTPVTALNRILFLLLLYLFLEMT
jgi:hypothetical protein